MSFTDPQMPGAEQWGQYQQALVDPRQYALQQQRQQQQQQQQQQSQPQHDPFNIINSSYTPNHSLDIFTAALAPIPPPVAAPVPQAPSGPPPPPPTDSLDDYFGFGSSMVVANKQSSPFDIFETPKPQPEKIEEENPFALFDAAPSQAIVSREHPNVTASAINPSIPDSYGKYAERRSSFEQIRNSLDRHGQTTGERRNSHEDNNVTALVPRVENLLLDVAVPPKDVDMKQLVYAKTLERSSHDLPVDASPLPDAEAILASGHILSRVSLRTILTKKWKQTYWAQYGPTMLLLFRTVGDYQDWLTNPYHSQKVRDFLIKQKIDFVEELNKPTVIGFQMTRPAMKAYERGDPMMWHFKLEKWMDYGATIAAAFASPNVEELGAIKKACMLCICNSRRGGDVVYAEARRAAAETKRSATNQDINNSSEKGYV